MRAPAPLDFCEVVQIKNYLVGSEMHRPTGSSRKDLLPQLMGVVAIDKYL